jgi:hypothetical protein
MDDPVLLAMVEKIHRMPALAGCMIGYEGDGQSRLLAQSDRKFPNSLFVAVVIEKIESSDPNVVGELRDFADEPPTAPGSTAPPAIVTNRSRLGPELVGASASCTLAVVAGLGVFAGAAAEVPTAGASSFLVIASWTGFVTGGMECLNGLVRVGAVFASPESNSLERWDQNSIYSTLVLIVDAFGIASSVASLPFAVRNAWAIIVRQRAFLASGLTFEALKRMNTLQRMRAISRIFEEAAKTPAGREALVEAAREAQVGVATMQRATGISVRSAMKMKQVISAETVIRLRSAIRDVLASVGTTAVSAMPSSAVGGSSGSVNYVINLLDAGKPPF